MQFEGGCYCGGLRYSAQGAPRLRAQCHCRECQYFSGGGPNFFMLMKPDGFLYTKGEPARFTRADLPGAVTREFCAVCGVHIATRRPDLAFVILKVGTLDHPETFDQPAMAIYTLDSQPFHIIPEGLPRFERTPSS